MPRFLYIVLFYGVLCASGYAQGKFTQAVKISSPIRIDGQLNESVWDQAPIATDFITNTPVYGNPASAKTEVRILYDNSAVYVGACIYDSMPMVRKQFTPRDQERQADVDYFSVFFDTYKDRQNAFQFLVTSRNVQSDARVSPSADVDFGVYGDLSWDAVWDSKVSFNEECWSVEMKIPYSALRFSKDIQEWGVQFLRFSRKLNETSFWNPVNPNVSGFVNQFGNLAGLTNLVPPLRLSFSPYLSGGYRGTPDRFNGYKSEWLRSGGMDVKYGLSESFTLDATLIPDFGQVISDNVVNNISPFEIQFRENRPFFTEGTELFNKAGIFYSRRVGRTPDLYNQIVDESRSGTLQNYYVLKNPDVTRLYNAIKLSGRTRNNLGIGIFNALTQPAKAELRHKVDGTDTTIVTEVLTNYNVFVLDQALKNRSYITFTNANVMREGHARDANVTALDVVLYDKKNRYGLAVYPRYSKIFDSAGGYDGFSNTLRLGKVSGKFQFSVVNEMETSRYDPNDLGFLTSPNEFSTEAEASYNIFTPTKHFLNQRYEVSVEHSYLFNPFEFQQTEFRAEAFWIFKNFWDLTIVAGSSPMWYNDFFELRTGTQKLKRSPYYFLFVGGSTDSRKKLFFRWNVEGAEGPLPSDPYYRLNLGVRSRFSDRFSLDLSFDRRYDNGQFGYAFLRDATTNAPILARRKFADVATVLSGIYNFTSRMNLTFRARHYWNRLNNTNLYDVLPDGYWTERFDLTPSNYNVNYNAFNLDLFYTWDFRLGSRIIFGWKNWLGRDYEYTLNGNMHRSYLKNAGEIFDTPHGNEVTLRFIYFLDYLQFSRRK